jgi:hypothetical protein
MIKFKLVDTMRLRIIATVTTLTVLCYFTIFGNFLTFKSDCGRNDMAVDVEDVGSIPFNQTTCSLKVFAQGGNQKVIAYVYYDDPDNSMTETRFEQF